MARNRKSQVQNGQPKPKDVANLGSLENVSPASPQIDNMPNGTDTNKDVPTTPCYSFSPWWLAFCGVDLMLNSCSPKEDVKELHQGHYESLVFPIQLALPEPLSATLHHLWLASAGRAILFFQLFYIQTYSNNTSNSKTWRKYSCYCNLVTVPIFCVHLVARILLDSEVIEDLTFHSYWVIVAWNAIAILAFGILNRKVLSKLSPNEDGVDEDIFKKGKKEKGNDKETSLGNKATFFKLMVWYRPYVPYLVCGYVFLLIHASGKLLKIAK